MPLTAAMLQVYIKASNLPVSLPFTITNKLINKSTPTMTSLQARVFGGISATYAALFLFLFTADSRNGRLGLGL